MENNEAYEVKLDEEITEEKPKPQAKAKQPQAEQGVLWEQMKFTISGKSFAKLMRDNDLFTYEDVRTNTRLVVGLLQRLYKNDLGAVLAFAKEHEEVENG